MAGVRKLMQSSLPELTQKLMMDMPKSLTVLGTIQNVMKGKLKANFYVDKWPHFSAVVVQSVWPRISGVADLSAYATCSEALYSVLTKGDLVTWGEKQELQRIEAKHADFLLKNLKRPGSTGDEADMVEFSAFPYHYTMGNKIKKREPPKGFSIGKLHPCHAEQVLANWPFYLDWTNREAYVEAIVKNFENIAIFSDQEGPNKPIAYGAQYPCGQLGFAYVNEKYRGNGMISLARTEMSRALIAAGFLPNGDTSAKLPLSKTGFVDSDYEYKYLQTCVGTPV